MQHLLSIESRVCQSIIMSGSIFTPNRVLHWNTNTALHVQAFLNTKLPPESLELILLWVYDHIFREERTEALFCDPLRFFQFYIEYKWKLNHSKFHPYMTETRWCGPMISADGIRQGPSKLYVTNMDCPTTRGQPQIFLSYMQLLRSIILNFQSLIHERHEFF